MARRIRQGLDQDSNQMRPHMVRDEGIDRTVDHEFGTESQSSLSHPDELVNVTQWFRRRHG